MQLKLQSITIHNFKSYKGTHIIQNLDPNFTAVIGPNGSGKSNIIDSILFVLGFRARKMRHSSLVDLIYNGDRREDMCYVELGFNKFRIRREAYLSRKSKYFIDGDESSTAAVSSLLSSEGVDMEHNRFLILQGEIESIAMIKPMDDGLLEYLEDVIGSNQYKSLIEKNESEIKQLEEEYETRAAKLKFYQKEYQHVEQKRDENLKALKKKMKLLQLKKSFYGLSSEMHKRALSGSCVDKKEVEERILELGKKNRENSAKLEALDKGGKEARNGLKKAENEYLGVKREHQRIERENKMLEEDKSKLEKQIKNLMDEIEDLKSEENMRRAEATAYNKEIDRNSAEIKKYNAEAGRMKNELQSEQEKINKKARKDIEIVRKGEESIVELLKKKSEMGRVLGAQETELGMLVSRKEEICREIQEIQGQLCMMEGIETNSKRSEAVVEEEIKSIEKDLGLTQREIAKRTQRAEEYKENEENNSKENELFRFIKDINGVYGKLRDLGTISSQYDVALRAAGKTLNSIVVDTTTTAEECVSVIRKRNLSRATFIILDKIGAVPNLPKESVPYLYSLVNCEQRFKKCFYFTLKDTLVCEDLETAEKIAFGKQRKRVVTFDGKLIEKSGVMSGGKPVSRIKRVDELERACEKMVELKAKKQEELGLIRKYKEKGKLEASCKSLNGKLNELLSNIGTVEKKINRKEISDLESRISQVKMEIDGAKAGIEGLVDTEMKSKRGTLQVLNEKIEMLEKRNLELRMHLSSEPGSSLKEKEKELKRKKDALKCISIRDISKLKDEVDKSEYEYKEKLNDLKIIQDEFMNVKTSLGNDYHLEIDLKNKLDDICDKIENCNKQMKEFSESIRKLDEEMRECLCLCNEGGEDAESLPEVKDMEDKEVEEMVAKEAERIKKIEKEVSSGSIDIGVFKDYENARSEYLKAKEEFTWFKSKFDELKNEVEALKKKRLDEFMDGFNQISKNLKEIYKMITYGGNAELELVDYLDPFSEGIVLSVMPPKKSWKNVSNLSGGEKTLSSLALIFALHKYKPSPFYVMDEIDAALDYRNVSVISNYIKEMSETAQFLVISLRNDMFELSSTLLGIYKTNNISRFLVVNINGLKLS